MAMNSERNGTQAVVQSLRTRQIAALKQLINLNQPVTGSLAVEPVWKVLIFDKYGQDVISPLLTVKDLRDLGVTLHLVLDSIREPLPDVPAVYFVSPDSSNITIVCQDMAAGLYECYYLNFISALSRPNLEQLATTAVQSNCVAQVQKVFDQFLNFVTLEDDLFTLRRHSDQCPLSYYAINRSDMSESSMNEIIDTVVDGLFSACVTMSTVPIIRCPKNNAAEQVAQRLDKKIRDNLRDARNNLFTSEGVRSGQFNFQRPLLLIVDRGIDLASMLHHTWNYQAMVHDLLDLELNRVTLSETGESGRSKTKEYDLNVSDKFWQTHKGSPFPEVAEAIQVELEDYRSSEEEIKRLKSAMGLGSEEDQAISMLNDTTAKLTNTVSSLPQLLDKKRLIDMHTNIATALLQHIKNRKLDVYFETEEKLLNGQTPERPVGELLREGECGDLNDKLRLLIMDFLCSQNKSESEINELMNELKEMGADDQALKYVRRWKSLSRLSSMEGVPTQSGGGTRTISMFSKLLNQSSQFVMEGVKNLSIKKHNLPITKLLDSIINNKSNTHTDEFRYFDPKLLRAADTGMTRRSAVFQECWVFVVGGGNYVEYENLRDYCTQRNNNTNPFRILYGTTELVNAEQFLLQLQRLGGEM